MNQYDQIEQIQLLTTKSKEKNNEKKKSSTPKWINRPFNIWRDKFQKDRCCKKEDVKIEFLTAAFPIFLLNICLMLYLYFGSQLFQKIDPNTSEKSLNQLILFCFTTLATVGYGDIYPVSFNGKLVCMLYCVIGIPLLVTTISTNSRIFVDFYNIFHQSFNQNAKHVNDLPIYISLLLLIFHCLIGGIIFSFWIDDMPFITALYFSFISISTIGFGDFTPTPEDWFQHFIIIAFLATGIGILTTFFGALQKGVMWIHNIGRTFSDSGDAEIWFNGNMMTVRELVILVAQHFHSTPEKLRDVLHDLDKILEVACRQAEEENHGIEECRLITANDHNESPTKKKRVVIRRNSSESDDNQATIHSITTSNQGTLSKESELAIQALGAIQHHLRKPSTKAKSGQSRNFSSTFKKTASVSLENHFLISEIDQKSDGLRKKVIMKEVQSDAQIFNQ